MKLRSGTDCRSELRSESVDELDCSRNPDAGQRSKPGASAGLEGQVSGLEHGQSRA